MRNPARLATLSFLAICFALLTTPAAAQQPQTKTGFQLREYKDEDGTHKYSLYVPQGYSPRYKWPLILFLHGAGERGTDGVLPTSIGLGPLVKLRENNFPFLVVFPQHEDKHGRILTGWDPSGVEGERALKILEQVERDFSVDTNREVLTGWSMGGYGVWEMAARNPGRWHSVVMLSGGGDPALAEKLKDVPLRLYHGAKDNIVRPENSQELADALEAAGAKAKFFEVPDADHNVWRQVFDNDEIYTWMLYPDRDPSTLKAVTSRPHGAPGQAPVEIPESAFVPALEVPRTVMVRLGNDALASLADSIPKVVEPESLAGWLNNISEWTEAKGYTFSVQMSGLSYSAQLYRATVKAYAKDRVNVQLGLSNVRVTIGSTSISGGPGYAVAGPMSVSIGHVRPVWLSFDVMPVVVDRQLKLRLLGSRFSIPPDNWAVSSPAGVDAHFGLFGPSDDEVASSLTSGIYSRRATIEQQVASVVPSLIKEMEKRLDVSSMAKGVGTVWPLPVYQPRLRLWPDQVDTDDKGISMVLGVTAAAVDPSQPPRKVRVAPGGTLAIANIPRMTDLRVGLAPEVLAPLTEMLVESDVARIHVADTPSKAMARLAEPQVMSEILPDLKRFGDRLQVYTELALAGPIHVVDLSGKRVPAVSSADRGADVSAQLVSTRAAEQKMALDAPRVKIIVGIKTDPSERRWRPCAEFDISLRQAVSPQLLKPDFQSRAVAMHWEDRADIEAKGHFVEGYEPREDAMDLDKFKTMFSAGWDEYIHREQPAQLNLPDIEFGFTRLRARDAGWEAPSLFATFGAAGLKITNSNDTPLVYETKGPYSGWGGPYTLAPGNSHEFPISYPMTFRRQQSGSPLQYTLPAGTHSEYRKPPRPGGTLGLYEARDQQEIDRTAEELKAGKGQAKDAGGEKSSARNSALPASERQPAAAGQSD